MKKLSIKTFSVLLALFFALSAGAVSFSAANPMKKSGVVKVVCGTYVKYFDSKDYSGSVTTTINAALRDAGKRATAEKTASVTVSKGNYRLTDTIRVFSNTVFDATGSQFSYFGNLLRNGFDGEAYSGKGFDSARNITVVGGLWEQLISFDYAGSDSPYVTHSTFRFAHCSNITVKNAQFKNNYNCHDIEVAGVREVRIFNNSFFNEKSVNTVRNSGGRESVQIDSCTESFMPYFPEYDRSGSSDVFIYRNSFKNKFRAVGSHHAIFGKPYDNIQVYKNEMDNIGGIGVYAVYWTNSKIYSNTMRDVGLGVDIKNMTLGGINFQNLNKLNYEQCENAVKKSEFYVFDNDIQVRRENNTFTRACGIRAEGNYLKADEAESGAKAGTYRIYNLKVGVNTNGRQMPNTISGNLSVGIQLNYGVDCLVKSNYVSMSGATYATANAVEIKSCKNTAVERNNLSDGEIEGATGVSVIPAAAGFENEGITLSSNQISNFKTSGIFVKKGNLVTLTDNIVRDCKGDALTVRSSTATAAKKNILDSEVRGAYICDNSIDTTMSSNTITRGTIGLYCVKAKSVFLSSNKIKADTYALAFKTVDTAEITSNSLTSSKHGALIYSDCNEISLKENKFSVAKKEIYYKQA